jgi:predicted DNA-binding transcriptional regulator AlpA
MTPKLLNTGQVAELLGVANVTVRLWRMQGKGPRFKKIGTLVRYDEADVLAYINAGTRVSTSQRAPAESASA